MPVGISAVNPWGIPLLGSCVLLASGFVMTWGHHALVLGTKDAVLVSMFFTILLGTLHYRHSSFTQPWPLPLIF